MAVDASVRRSILQVLYAGRKADELRTPALAEELGLDLELVEAYLDVMEDEGLVNVSRRFGGGHGVELTSRGLLEAKTPAGESGAAIPRVPAPVTPAWLLLEPGEAGRKLQEQLDELEGLIARGLSATLDQMKDWTYWTVTVIEKTFGGNSRELWEFRGVSGGVWPSGYDAEAAEAEGYRERLPQWRRLLRTWIRAINEFGPEAAPVERYLPCRSQFDAYVFLKETLARAAGSVTLVDPYTDHTTLQPLVSVGAGVQIRVLTVNPSRDFKRALDLFRQQWSGKIEARRGSKELHDRFLVVDDKVFFSGASFKDLGQKGSIVDEIRTEAVKNALKKDIETWWEVAEPIV